MEGCELAFHVAADYRLWVRNPEELYETNVTGTINVLRAAFLKRVERVVDAKRIVPIPVSVGAPSLDDLIALIKPERYEFEPYGIEANDAMPPDVPRRPVPTAAPAAP